MEKNDHSASCRNIEYDPAKNLLSGLESFDRPKEPWGENFCLAVPTTRTDIPFCWFWRVLPQESEGDASWLPNSTILTDHQPMRVPFSRAGVPDRFFSLESFKVGDLENWVEGPSNSWTSIPNPRAIFSKVKRPGLGLIPSS
jgi:hypothetical protein